MDERLEWTQDAGQPDVPADLGPGCFREESLWTTGGTTGFYGGTPGLYSEGHLLCDSTLPHIFSRAMSTRKVTIQMRPIYTA